MDQLPAELLCQITVLCDYGVLFRLRSVSKQLRDIVTPLAFEHIYVGWIKEHLERLESLAISPLAKHVRRLTVNTEMLPRFDDPEWMEYLRLTERGGEIVLDHPYLTIKMGNKCYRSLRNLILDWNRYHTVATHQQMYSWFCGIKLLSTLSRFGNIQSLELIDRRSAELDERKLACERLATCSPWKQTLLDTEDYNGFLRWRSTEDRDRPMRSDMSSAWTLSNIAHAMASRRSDEKFRFAPAIILKIHTGHHIPLSEVVERTNGIPHQDRWPDTVVVEGADDLFKTLTKINITFGDDIYPYSKAVCVEIVRGLSKATNLKYLELDKRHENCNGCDSAFKHLKHSWALLEHLRLSGYMQSHHVLPMVELHAQSLRVLELVDMESPERWGDFFERIRSTSTLERANVQSLTDWLEEGNREEIVVAYFSPNSGPKSEMHRTVEDFLVRKVDKLPRQEEWDFETISVTRYSETGAVIIDESIESIVAASGTDGA